MSNEDQESVCLKLVECVGKLIETNCRLTEWTYQEHERLLKENEEMSQLVDNMNKERKRKLNERIRQLRERARRIDDPDGANADNEREIASRTERTATEIRSATIPEQPTGNTDTDALIRQAEAAVANTRDLLKQSELTIEQSELTIEQSETTITSSEANRQEQELTEQRQAELPRLFESSESKPIVISSSNDDFDISYPDKIE